jgi:hypothetical protein
MRGMRLEEALPALSVGFALLVMGCTGEPSGVGDQTTPLRAQVASGTVLAVNVHDAIICVVVERPTAELSGGCYDLRARTDVRRGDEVRVHVVDDTSTSDDGNKRDEVVAIDVLRKA